MQAALRRRPPSGEIDAALHDTFNNTWRNEHEPVLDSAAFRAEL
jgi:hypothetical protein